MSRLPAPLDALPFPVIAAKAWKDIWGCGQGVAPISAVQRTADYVAALRRDHAEAREALFGR